MDLRVYNWEKFDRNKRWYVFFALVLITIIWLSLWKQNFVWVIVLFFIVGAYFYYSIISNQTISLKIDKQHITINNKIYLRWHFKSYSIEIDKRNQQIKNLVLITEKWHTIYTINDKKEKTKDFLVELNNFLPLVWEYEQPSLEKLARILKL